jgi:glycerophosphoryl diester phosphodiesterase
MLYRPLAAEAGRIHVCGHRGHSADAPENTLPALVAAAERGATCCEIDVVLTRDAEVVLLHDEILDRTTNGRGLVADHDLVSLRALDAGGRFAAGFAGTPVPTLAEALATARRHGLGLLVEIKERRRVGLMLERLAALLEAERAADGVLVISFDHPSLARLRGLAPSIRTELITHARHVDPAGLARAAGAVSVAIEFDMFHPEDARALHAAGVAVRVTLPRPERLALRRGYGLDDEARVTAALRAGLIDVLGGDDVAFLAELVAACRRPRGQPTAGS